MMFRLSKLTDYAAVVLGRLSTGHDVQTAPYIAGATGIPEPTVSKVLKLLALAGLVSSMRGSRGGYKLARALTSISICDLIEAMEGPIALTACVEGSVSECDCRCQCDLHRRWDQVNDSVRSALTGICLSDLMTMPPKAVSLSAAE
jgi:FeS assembly SUF system regulator